LTNDNGTSNQVKQIMISLMKMVNGLQSNGTFSPIRPKKILGQDGHWVSSQISICTNKNDILPMYLGIIVTNYICT
jgi:hypothetical protein